MEKRDEKIYCNCCGKPIQKEQGIYREDSLSVQKEWGYFSEKDREVHKFTLCETCYDRITGQFVIPVEVEIKTELL